MSRNCICKVCGRPTDCGGDVCEIHTETVCSNGRHCGEEDTMIREVKENVFLFQTSSGTYYLKRISPQSSVA
ncbi:MAG: hypothetical protein DDT33_01333 [Firmicutes bacterium]|nr:hypothetical protein [Bacillota bacterium]